VLLVDDNAGFRASLGQLLEGEGLEIAGEACTGAEALAIAEDLRPDVVLMDLRMPGMNGIETTRRLKELQADIRVVALTGSENQDEIRDMLTAGASGYVLKDSDGDEIVKAIREAAGGGGGVISAAVTPAVIDELSEALGRERARSGELERAHQALIERAAHRSALIARLGHELRTPVTVILGMADTLRSDRVPAEDRVGLLESLTERAAKLAQLVDRFEAVVDSSLDEWPAEAQASGDVGKQAGLEQVDIALIARSLATRHERVEVMATGPAVAMLDLSAAERILTELVQNATSFSPDHEPVHIRVDTDGAPSQVLVHVVDRGPGIDPAALDRIFEPLEQEEDLNTRAHQGVGLGLTIARLSARAMGGDIVVTSTRPGETVFTWVINDPTS
jgi:signal transduction histidine kinase